MQLYNSEQAMLLQVCHIKLSFPTDTGTSSISCSLETHHSGRYVLHYQWAKSSCKVWCYS